ncbi:GAF domain-containing protein [Candidatus Chloroploca sp. M-50]|uniref:GAF domain-containing protein n=1 Tax=Candidatus Chloroploca mongolica TaxID=2528176 RepID=A0ABS4D3U7_9CHLR|nr:HD domain-containing phosphohydrolase [Candidatus Chloroploca mongolica]MBP1464101.1 GAF domain-containing protein [Candidatus Chloroploca mongolica]
MPDQQTRLTSTIDVIQRANQIAASTELDGLLDQMLDLLIEMTGAEAGTLYLYEEASHELIFTVVKGNEASRSLIGMRINADRGVAGLTLRQGQPLFIANVVDDPHWDRAVGELAGMELRTMYCVPLMLRGVAVGVVQLFNLTNDTCDEPDEIALIDLICSRLVTEVEKARLLTEARQRERRQHVLIEIISRLTTTLNRDDLLNRIMEYACELLDIEAASIWLYDEIQNELVLYLATGYRRSEVEAKRIPAGQGIIGHVVATGETVVVNDVHHDQRFYRQVDSESGFVTRSILCVPLRAPKIDVGGQLGILEGRIIGGAQALNPRQGRSFNAEDISLFESLAGQAATIIRLAQLYTDVETLSTRIIDAITGAIDLKDPYTRGHSQRVSDFSVAIAQELGLDHAMIYRVRIASKLHDVGKIRIPDRILKKRGTLTEAEFRQMRQHPLYGVEFLKENGLLELELLRDAWQALAQHHERLDGGGYPYGLKDVQISLIGRIVAVADVFDAITSHRTYRPARSVEEALAILQRIAGRELDEECVAALLRARSKGAILTQDERTMMGLLTPASLDGNP